MSGDALDVKAITDEKAAAQSGVAHAEALVALADAAVAAMAPHAEGEADESALAAARERVARELGPEALVDAAAIVGNFSRMVRIADGTGIALDAPVAMLSQDIRKELDLERFGSSANTPKAGTLRRAAGRLLSPLLVRIMPLLVRPSNRA